MNIKELIQEAESLQVEERALVVDKYESEQYPIEYPDPVRAIKNRMQDLRLRQKDLTPIVGSPSKISKILNYKWNLSLSMMRPLNKHLNIPAEVLLHEDIKKLIITNQKDKREPKIFHPKATSVRF